VSQHPLIDLANDREVRQSKGFREAAARLTGESLAEMYQQEVANAPKRYEADKKFLAGQKGNAPRGGRSGKPHEHLSIALVNQFRSRGEGLDLPQAPAGDTLDSLAYQVPLKVRQTDPDKRIGKIDVIGVIPEDRLALVTIKYVAPTATRGSTVVLTVSRGQKEVKVPVVVGAQRSLAVQQIRGRGLSPSVAEEESPKPAGEVIAQSPSAGSELPRGSTVSIVVSRGEEQAQAPNVIGKERREAVEAVREAGLEPSVREEETEVPSQVGRVTDQFPPPGAEVEPGSTVTLTVGKRAPESEAAE